MFGIFSYIEKIERYWQGEPFGKKDTNSVKLLKDGFRRIFSTITSGDKIDKILIETRHNMMHGAMIGDKILLNYTFAEDVEYEGSNKTLKLIKINPTLVLKTIEEDIDSYLEKFKNKQDTALLNNFTKSFNTIYKDEIKILTNN